jgi:iron complex outermembrane receptor protein
VTYRIKHSGTSATSLFLQGNNLLNKDIRVHTSFLKDFAPQAGRSIFAGLRSNF